MRQLVMISLVAWLVAGPSSAVCIFGIGDCPSGFVRLVPISTSSGTSKSAPSQGYLRIEADSDTGAMQTNERLQKLDSGVQYLSVTAELSLPGGGTPELPLILYDLVGRKEVTTISYGLTRGQYIDLESGAQPRVTIRVRAIPQSIGSAYLRAFQKVDEYVKNAAPKTLLSAVPQLTLATSVLSSFAQAAIGDQKEWESAKIIGLASGSDAALPLNGEPVILFLVPTTQYDQQQLYKRKFSVQNGRVFSDGKSFNQLPYVILRALASDYRPLSPDFVQSQISCSSTQQDVADINAALATGALSPRQREYERRLVARWEIYRRAQQQETFKSIDSMANCLFALLNLTPGNDDLWKKKYAATAEQLDNCIEQTVANQGLSGDKWSRLREAITEAKVWQSKSRGAQDNARKALLEDSLKTIVMPITAFRLDHGDAYEYLNNARNDIEEKLRPFYEALTSNAIGANPSARERVVAEIKDAITKTACASCKETLKATLSDIVAASHRAEAEEKLIIAKLQSELADKIGEAQEIAKTAEQTSAATNQAQSVQQANSELKKSVNENILVLNQTHPAEADLRVAIQKVESDKNSVQEELNKPPSQ